MVKFASLFHQGFGIWDLGFGVNLLDSRLVYICYSDIDGGFIL